MKKLADRTIPKVSIILPIYNEKDTIRQCLTSLAVQDRPVGGMEVLIIDGMSTDGTREIARSFLCRNGEFHLIDNPRRDTISALNLGIANARGNFIVRVDGHAFVERDYVRQCLAAHERTGAECVGGLMRPAGKTYLQKAIALATSSPFGVGGGKFHYHAEECYVDTVYLGAYPKKLFTRIGGYDPAMKYSEDNDFNYRVRRAGGKILLTPSIKSIYLPRSSLATLFVQYFRYGFYKLNFFLKHNGISNYRHLAPSIFALALLSSSLLALLGAYWSLPLVLLLLVYFGSALISSLNITKLNNIRLVPLLPFVFATLHVSYGLGFLTNCGLQTGAYLKKKNIGALLKWTGKTKQYW